MLIGPSCPVNLLLCSVQKDEEIESLKLQNSQAISEAVEQALRNRADKWRQKEEQYKLQIERVQKHNGELENALASIHSRRSPK